MTFSYDGYRSLLRLLKAHGYETANYHNWQEKGRCVILRHDADNALYSEVVFAELERDMGVKSTYFILVTSDFYNIFSRANRASLRRIEECGHEIGLHFDEANYPELMGDPSAVRDKILEERDILQKTVMGGGNRCFHAPSQQSDLGVRSADSWDGQQLWEDLF